MVSMVLPLRMYPCTIDVISSNTRFQEMHSSITGVAEGSYPTPEEISYYIYKHGTNYQHTATDTTTTETMEKQATASTVTLPPAAGFRKSLAWRLRS